MTHSFHYDVAVIGAGMAGLACAQQLTQAGYRVVVLEKSRGVGGRIATRRLHGTLADHGTCYLTPKGEVFSNLMEQLLQAGILQPWTDTVHELDLDGNLQTPGMDDRYSRYVAPAGMTVIAKFLAAELEIRLNHQVETIAHANSCWHLTSRLPDGVAETSANALVITAPAPQAIALLQPLVNLLPEEFMQQVKSVQFSPCLSVMASYSPECQQDWVTRYPSVKALTLVDDLTVAWVGLDSSKRLAPTVEPVFVLQSSAAFANQYLEAPDLNSAASKLLNHAASRLAPWLATPAWFQIHRWRYAFARSFVSQRYLAASTPIPLICAGDWCSGMKVENAFLSGLAAAEQIARSLNPS